MAYTVLARRYRSQRFDDIAGQDAIAHTLKNAILSDRVAHAYLFCGTRGVGKTTMARVLAKALNCQSVESPTTEPCCECESCIAINSGEDIDVIEIDGASNNGVENIRDLRQNAMYRPARGRYKIYIIDEIHMLSTGAFNALLKILEEPPAHVKFIFATTEPNKVLPTIQSRCQRFDFRSIDPQTIQKQVKMVLEAEGISCDDDFAVALSRLANGSMRDALSLLDQILSTGADNLTLEVLENTLGEPGRAEIARMTELIGDSDAPGVLEVCDELLSKGMSPEQITDSLIDSFRDLMITASAGAGSSLIVQTAAEAEETERIAGKFDIASLVYAVTTMERMRGTVKKSDNPRAILEAALMRLTLSEHFINVQTLVRQTAGGGGGKKNSQAGGKPAGARKPSLKQAFAEKNGSAADKLEQAGSVECGNLEELQSRWQEVVQKTAKVNMSLGANLSNAEPAGFENGNLVLHAKTGMAGRLLQTKKQEAEKVFAKILGTEIALQVRQEASSSGEPANKPKGAKSSFKDQRQAMKDPGVQKVLNTFNAQIIGISRPKNQ
ncbi:DNA polymerase III subunit gamma/tau [Sedimentisphaera cyanobacteriorum]|uniref:DNA polymerase III subunit gamma/tau n=1 Tax=Sedimentisphaera cyanobacteriorum TaxID=1940790 RepID=A0A1Q2HT24_9BACT|nr:DNA polymerase III subunit gamma/tau [Sedimentisphaera cyanobacteriorum]AQQ10463.1 DNA polymerase III subunit gamma/tau [Sedimentisphaera cyanobacteriorum]